MSLLMNLKYSLTEVCHQYLVQEMKDQGVGEDKRAQGSGGKGWCNLHDEIIL